jgi:hypothetical protein
MATGILERDSAISFTNAIWWHQKLSRRKFGERWRGGHVSRDLLAFNVNVMFPPNDVWCFGSVTLLSRELSHLAWIGLSFDII